MTYDLEDLLSDLETYLKANLNTKISAIEAEKVANGKGLTPTLATVSANAYFEQNWNTNILSYSPAIFYGVENVEAVEKVQGHTIEKFTLFVECVLVDNGVKTDITKRVNRYARAIKETLEEGWSDVFGGGSKVVIETVAPASFRLALDTSETIRVGGVSIVTILG